MKTFKNQIISITCCLLMIVATGCKKDNSVGGSGAMSIKMTDAPAVYTAVNVDIQSVQIHYADETKGKMGWVMLATKAGIYDLLELQNDVTVTLAEEKSLPLGAVTQLRLLLGDKNTLITGDFVFELKVPSSVKTGIKIDLNTAITFQKTIDVTLDLVADSSIILEGNGSYVLKPVIKVKSIVQN